MHMQPTHNEICTCATVFILSYNDILGPYNQIKPHLAGTVLLASNTVCGISKRWFLNRINIEYKSR